MGLRTIFRRRIARWKSECLRRRTVAKYNATPEVRTILENGPGQVTIARIIGNDLYPRHTDGQALNNLYYILDHEPKILGWKKLFVLNRLFDKESEAVAAERIQKLGHQVIILPFDSQEYAIKKLNLSQFGGCSYFESSRFQCLRPDEKNRERIWALGNKIQYAMNINSARNVAIATGHSKNDWVLLLDGGCFLSESAANTIATDLSQPPFAPYVIVPMIRVQTNDEVFDTMPSSDFSEEPHIAIHRSAREKFDERFPYGLRDKSSLLHFLGVPGPWDYWRTPEWLPKPLEESPDKMFFKRANASVFRLASDKRGGKLEAKGARDKRYTARNKAILATITMLDKVYGAEDAKITMKIVGV